MAFLIELWQHIIGLRTSDFSNPSRFLPQSVPSEGAENAEPLISLLQHIFGLRTPDIRLFQPISFFLPQSAPSEGAENAEPLISLLKHIFGLRTPDIRLFQPIIVFYHRAHRVKAQRTRSPSSAYYNMSSDFGHPTFPTHRVFYHRAQRVKAQRTPSSSSAYYNISSDFGPPTSDFSNPSCFLPQRAPSEGAKRTEVSFSYDEISSDSGPQTSDSKLIFPFYITMIKPISL